MDNDSNHGFWDRPADERAERMRKAADRGGVENFFDLPPEDRAQAYEDSRAATGAARTPGSWPW